MPDLLLELFSEEIPARMQARAAADFERLVTSGLREAGLGHGAAQRFVTPRRLALHIAGLDARSADVAEERKGPRVGAPDAAVQGFLKSAGLGSLDEAEVQSDPKKGDFYIAKISRPGRAADAIVAAVLPDVIANFPWPKSMRWGAGALRWVRPLHSIVCLLDGRAVDLAVDGVSSGAETYGHRFMAPAAITVTSFDAYRERLAQAKVLLETDARIEKIRADATALAKRHKLQLIEDDALLAENAGLTEWPVPLMGQFDPAFLEVPGEVLTTAMKVHQKCFSLLDTKTGKLANRFIMVANLEAPDGGARIIAGNERVIAARLSDARFFWAADRARPLVDLLPKLRDVTFHEKLGSQADRVARIAALARDLAPAVGADPDQAEQAARLCKADLLSGTVGEFPELQGLIGRYIADAQGISAPVAAAIEDHYRPKGAGDAVPTAPVSIAVALADKLDLLVGFWAIGEKPTGSGDPFALRRAALGVIRIVLENRLRQSLAGQCDPDLLGFFAERLRVYLRDEGVAHDVIEAVYATGALDDLLLVKDRITALQAFLATDDGKSLTAGIKRAANILRIEEKKDKTTYSGGVDVKRLKEPAEKALARAIEKAKSASENAIAASDFTRAMAALAELRAPVDQFFEAVTVNADDAGLRANRLTLLAEIRAATLAVADFSKLEG